MNTNWTKEELNTYLLIYCANADFVEKKVEIDLIKSKTAGDFEKIHSEFKKDNDYQSIQKIQAAMKRFSYTSVEKNQLLDEIKELFLSDDKFDILEKNLLRGLNQILN